MSMPVSFPHPTPAVRPANRHARLKRPAITAEVLAAHGVTIDTLRAITRMLGKLVGLIVRRAGDVGLAVRWWHTRDADQRFVLARALSDEMDDEERQLRGLPGPADRAAVLLAMEGYVLIAYQDLVDEDDPESLVAEVEEVIEGWGSIYGAMTHAPICLYDDHEMSHDDHVALELVHVLSGYPLCTRSSCRICDRG